MNEREKVIKGLECCNRENEDGCNECPYNFECFPGDEMFSVLATDALELLKWQEERIKTLESLRRIEQEGR